MRTLTISNEPITGKIRKVVINHAYGNLTYQIELHDEASGLIIKGESTSVGQYVDPAITETPEIAAARQVMQTKIEDAMLEFEALVKGWGPIGS